MDASKTTTSRHFNSQPHKEADGGGQENREENLHFNSQPHKEADDTWKRVIEHMKAFQLTASQGG